MTLTLNDYLLVSGLLFAIGLSGVMLRRNRGQKSSNSKALLLLKYHLTVAQLRLCDSAESCFSRGGRGAVRGANPNMRMSDNAAGGKHRHVCETQSRVPVCRTFIVSF